MSTAEAGSAKSGLGWWPKLVLWTLVLVFGTLYLGSVKRNSAVDAPGPATRGAKGAAAEVAPPAPVPASPPEEQAPAAGAAAGLTGGTESAGAELPETPSNEPEPVRAAESAAFADSLLNKPPSDQDREGPAEAAEPASQPPQEQGKAGLPPPSEASTAAAAEPPTPVQSGGASPPVEKQAPAPEDQAAERARIIMEYEAMRRAAEEHMRRSWGQMGMPAPVGAPYARPGYGHGPGVYPAR